MDQIINDSNLGVNLENNEVVEIEKKSSCLKSIIITVIILLLLGAVLIFIAWPHIKIRYDAGKNATFFNQQLEKIKKAMDSKDYDQVIALYQEEVIKVPNFTPSYLGLAAIYSSLKYEKRDFNQARDYCQQAVKIDRLVIFEQTYKKVCKGLDEREKL